MRYVTLAKMESASLYRKKDAVFFSITAVNQGLQIQEKTGEIH